MTHAQQLERETEQTRNRLAASLDELRASMTPGQILDQVTDYARRGSAGRYVRNLRREAVNNPVPLALMGAGLAWLLVAGGTSRRSGACRSSAVEDAARGTFDSAADAVGQARDTVVRGSQSIAGAIRERMHDTRNYMNETGDGIADSTRTAVNGASDRAGSAATGITETAAEIRDRMTGAATTAASSIRDASASAYDGVTTSVKNTTAAVTQSARSLANTTSDRASSFAQLCREQPLLLAGLGVALGAAVGALLPSTRTENSLMGETSDNIKGRAADLAQSQYQNAIQTAKQAGEEAAEAFTEEMKTQEFSHSDGYVAQVEAAQDASLVPAPGEEDHAKAAPENFHGGA